MELFLRALELKKSPAPPTTLLAQSIGKSKLLENIERGKKIMKWVKRIVLATCVALLVWIATSYVDVVTTNNNPEETVSSWNFFIVTGRGA